MGIVQNPRNLQTFKTKLELKSKNTQAVYHDAFTNFGKFCIDKLDSNFEDVISDLKITTEETIYDTLQSWISWNADGNRSRNTIRTYLSCLNMYFHYRGIKLDNRDIKQNLTLPRIIHQELYGLSISDIKSILDVARYDKKTMYLCQLSSGMRTGEILQLRKSDLDLTTKRIMVKLRPSIAKGNKARTTFFSKEAGSMLRTILKRKADDDLIFGTDTSTITVVRQYNEQILVNYCKKVGLAEKYENSNRFKITSHSFRAFFITKLSRHDENFAKKLSGQTGYLLQYDRLNDEEKLEKYIEFENDLTIYSDNKTLTELEQLKQKQVDQDLIQTQMDEIKQEIEELKYGPTGRRNKYNQNYVNAPVPSEMKILTMAIPILLELLFPEEKKRDMMKEFEKAELEDRKPDLHKIFGSRQMDEDHIRFLKKFLREHRHKKDSSKSTNYVKPRLRIENLEAMLQNHN